EKPWDFVSLSDTISYLPEEQSNRILERWPQQTKSGAITVIRAFMKGPTDLRHADWTALANEEKKAWQTDVTGVYKFHIMQKK
ncbi:MAG: DUF3419 domain-containing protein, partial [Bdellovibrionaceae bacterium]|nr:DUF3419 domain-containing protein [Pseudobdellovibrionaceae bacterium]